MAATTGRDEEALVRAARSGRHDAFTELVDPYQTPLRAHCYRMLGAVADTDDAVQETLLRAWRGLDRFEGRSSFRSWLYTVATNVSLRAIERRAPRVLPVDHVPGDPPDRESEGARVWLEPYPDTDLPAGRPAADPAGVGPDAVYEQRESVELAFAAALQHLPARQRAALILRDVLGFSAREAATALDTTPSSIDSMMQRARTTVRERVPARSQQTTLRRLGDTSVRQVVARFAAAWENHDVDGLVAMLADDARLAMPPESGWFQGRAAVAAFLRQGPLAGGTRFRMVATGASAQPALAAYLRDERTGRYEAESLIVLTLAGTHVAEVTAFRDPDLFARFGLPDHAPEAT